MIRNFSLVLMVVCALVLMGCGNSDAIVNNEPASKSNKILDAGVASLDKFEPTTSYEPFEIEGWIVRVSNDYTNHPDKRKLVLDEMKQQLNAVNKVVPQSALSKLKNTVFWIEYENRPGEGAVYHPSRQWLVENDYNPDKAGGIELQFNFYLWRKVQPWIVMHELSHAYHDKHLGYDNAVVLQAFEKARLSSRYDNVKHVNGSTQKAYAMNNELEYFAELTEAYFGYNDQQPFDRKALKNFDPVGFEMVQTVWND